MFPAHRQSPTPLYMQSTEAYVDKTSCNQLLMILQPTYLLIMSLLDMGLMFSTYCILYTSAFFLHGCNVVSASLLMIYYNFLWNWCPPDKDCPASITSCTLIAEDTSIGILPVDTGIGSTFQGSPPASAIPHIAQFTGGPLQLSHSVRIISWPLVAVYLFIAIITFITH